MGDRLKKNILELTRVTASEYLQSQKLPLLFVADNIRSMQNVGSLLRTADAFMVSEMIMCGITGCPPHPEIAKTALGADESVRWSYCADTLECVRQLRSQGWKVYALEQTHNSIPLQEFIPEPGERYVIVAGNEVSGVQQSVVDIADGALEIPQHGVKHSLNVAVSGAIAMWHFYSHIYPAVQAARK